MKSFRFPLTLALLLLALLPVSCRPEMDFVENSFRSGQAEMTGGAQTVSMLFGSAAGSASIDLTANRSWEATFVNDRARNWCTLSASSGGRGTVTLTVGVTMNGDYDERSASILFTCDDVTRTIVVTQKQRDALLVTSNRVYVPQAGGTFLVEVQANIDFSTELSYLAGGPSGWIHDLGTKGLSQHILTFQVDENPTLVSREGLLTVRSPLGEETVHFYQDGEIPTLVVSTHEQLVSPEGGPFDVQVRSNMDVELLLPDTCSWLQEVKSKTLSTNTYTFSAERNDGRLERKCRLVFRNEEWAMADTVFVRQNCQPILLSEDRVYLPKEASSFTVLVNGQDPALFKLEISDSWMELTGSDVDDTGTHFHFQATENESGQEREGQVRVYFKDFQQPDVVTVIQSGVLPSFSFTTARTEVQVPLIAVPDSLTFVFWGDGDYERYTEGLTHTYKTPGVHTVTVEGRGLSDVRFPLPENGVHYDFSKLKQEGRR